MDFRLAKKKDLIKLADIYKKLYGASVLQEDWSTEKSYSLLKFFYKKQKDIFVVAEINNKVAGAVMSIVKPWHDGNRLIETEIFVASEYQGKGVASRLYYEHYKLAMAKYDVKIIEAHTYQESDGNPLNWYKKQGFEIIDSWYVINGDIKKAYEYFDKKIKEL